MRRLMATESKDILVENLLVRATFWGRFKGLLFYRGLNSNSGMLLLSTKRVHTFGMLFPLDLYYLDGSMCLIDTQSCVMPWKKPKSPARTQHVLEIQHLAFAKPLRLNIGEQVSILWE